MAGQKTDERDVDLGRRMVERRKRAGLTQRTVAQSFGMSAAQFQKYEKGTNRISAIHLAILSRLTGTPIEAFFAGARWLDEFSPAGFSDAPQDAFAAASPTKDSAWTDFALVVARHVSERLDDDARRDVAAAVDVFRRELKD